MTKRNAADGRPAAPALVELTDAEVATIAGGAGDYDPFNWSGHPTTTGPYDPTQGMNEPR